MCHSTWWELPAGRSLGGIPPPFRLPSIPFWIFVFQTICSQTQSQKGLYGICITRGSGKLETVILFKRQLVFQNNKDAIAVVVYIPDPMSDSIALPISETRPHCPLVHIFGNHLSNRKRIQIAADKTPSSWNRNRFRRGGL